MYGHDEARIYDRNCLWAEKSEQSVSYLSLILYF